MRETVFKPAELPIQLVSSMGSSERRREEHFHHEEHRINAKVGKEKEMFRSLFVSVINVLDHNPN